MVARGLNYARHISVTGIPSKRISIYHSHIFEVRNSTELFLNCVVPYKINAKTTNLVCMYLIMVVQILWISEVCIWILFCVMFLQTMQIIVTPHPTQILEKKSRNIFTVNLPWQDELVSRQNRHSESILRWSFRLSLNWSFPTSEQSLSVFVNADLKHNASTWRTTVHNDNTVLLAKLWSCWWGYNWAVGEAVAGL